MPSKKKKSPRTIVVVVQDKSGSMHDRYDATISGYNEYVTTLRREATGKVLLTLTQFDTSITNRYAAQPIEEVPLLDRYSYRPGGMTALYDAIGRAVQQTENDVRQGDRVLIVIMTDGYENSSRQHGRSSITSLMNRKRDYGWEFIFLGAGEDSWAAGRDLGFSQVDSITYTGDADDHRYAVQDAAFAASSVSRGSTAQAYLAVSPTKSRLESKAHGSTQQAHTVTPRSTSRSPSNASHYNWKKQKRDHTGRFIKS